MNKTIFDVDIYMNFAFPARLSMLLCHMTKPVDCVLNARITSGMKL